MTLGEGTAPAVAPAAATPAKENRRATQLLPDGSQLKGVMIPRYDENHKLSAVLKASIMKLVSDGIVEGSSIVIESYKREGGIESTISLENARVFEENGSFARLVSNRPVEITSERLTAKGSGLYYLVSEKKGFLMGPGSTTITNPVKTAMNTSGSSFRATAAAAGLSLASQLAVGGPPPPMTQAELDALHVDARSSKATLVEKSAETREALSKELSQSEAATKAATLFLVQTDLPPVADDEIKPATEPLAVKASATDTIINFEGGMYFDAVERVLVYRGNVRVKDPRFDLEGINELKVFFGKKEDKKKDPKTGSDPAPSVASEDPEGKKSVKGFGAGAGPDVGEVEKIIATGAVKMTEKPKDGKDGIMASGAIFSYNLKDDVAIISGGYPWFVRGPQRMRAMQPNLSLRVRDLNTKDPKVNTEGHWEQFLNFEDMKR